LKKYAFSEHAKSSKIKLNFGEAGRTGLNRYGGIVSEEWEPQLQGARPLRHTTEWHERRHHWR